MQRPEGPAKVEEWRTVINNNLKILCEITVISPRFLDSCVQNKVLTTDESTSIKLVKPDYDMASRFYNVLLKKDKGKFQKAYEIMHDAETLQSDEVLAILRLNKNEPEFETEKNPTQTNNHNRKASVPTAMATTEVEGNYDISQQDKLSRSRHESLGVTSSNPVSSSNPETPGILLYMGSIKEAIEILGLPPNDRSKLIVIEHERETQDECKCLERVCDFLSDWGMYEPIIHVCNQYANRQEQCLQPAGQSSSLEVLYQKGVALMNLERKEEALTIFQNIKRQERLVSGGSQHLTTRAQLASALTLSDLGRHTEAMDCLGDLPSQLEKAADGESGLEGSMTMRAKLYKSIILSRLGNVNEAIDLCQSVLTTLKRVEGEQPITTETKFHLACMYMDSRNYEEALELFDSAHKRFECHLAPDHPRIIFTVSKIAQTMSARGDHDKAVEKMTGIWKKLEPDFERNFPTDSLKIRRYYAQIQSRLGNFQIAGEIYEDVFKKQEQRAGIEHPSTLETKYQIGVNLKGRKDFGKAFVVFTQVGKTQSRVLGIQHPSTLRTRSDIAAVKSELGKFEDDLCKEFMSIIIIAFQTSKLGLGSKHSDTLRTRRFYAQAMARLGKFEDAKSELIDILKTQGESLGHDHPSTLETHYQLGLTHKLAKDSRAAMAVLNEVNNALKIRLGEAHPSTLVTQLELAIVHSDMNSQDKAWRLVEDVFQKCTESVQFPAFDTHVGNMYRGLILSRRGKHAEGLKILRQVLEAQGELLGWDHPAAVETRYHVGITLAHMQGHREALNEIMEVYKAQLRVFGPDHPSTIQTKTDLAREYSELGRNDKAFTLLNEVLEKTTTDQRVVNNLRTKRYQAMALSRLGKFKDALEILKDVETQQEEALGRVHPSYLETQFQIGAVLKKLHPTDQAFNKWNEVLNVQLAVLVKDHPKTLRTRIAILGTQLYAAGECGKPEETLNSLKVIIQSGEKFFGNPEHKEVLKAKRYCAQLLCSMSKYDEAMELFQAVRSRQAEIVGMEHPITLETAYHLGTCLVSSHRVSEALDTFQSIKNIQERIFEPEHPSTKRTAEAIERLKSVKPISSKTKKTGILKFLGKNK